MEIRSQCQKQLMPLCWGSYVCQGARTGVKKRAHLQDIHCNLCASSLARQTGSEQPCSLAWVWLGQVGVTVESRYLIFPVASFGVAPSSQFSLVSNPFFHRAKVPQTVAEGLLQSLLGFSPSQAQQAGVVLGSDGQCWGQVAPSLSLLGEVLFRSNSPVTNFSLM